MYKINAKQAPNGVPSPFVNMVNYFNQRTAETHAGHLLPHLKSNFKLLDIGCGGGSITLGFAKYLKDGEVIGLDVEQDLIAVAKELAAKNQVSNVSFDLGNIHDLSRFEENTFDVVHAHQVILHLEDPIHAIKEMRRVLKPSGILALRDNATIHTAPPQPVLDQYMLKFVEWHRSLGKHPDGGLKHQVWTAEAAFDRKKMTLGSVSWDERSSKDQVGLVQVSAVAWNATARKAGVITAEEDEEWSQAWNRFENDPDGRIIALDSTLIAIK